MPKISAAQGPSHEGVIAEHDADLRESDDARVDVQEPILAEPQEDPGLSGKFFKDRNKAEDVEKTDEGTDYSAYTVKELVAEIERRNEADDKDLATTGNKPELVARLVEDDEQDEE